MECNKWNTVHDRVKHATTCQFRHQTKTNHQRKAANSILERVRQVLGNMLRTKNLQKYDFDDMAHWSELVASVAWAISLKDVDKNNIRENSSRIHHDYQVGDKVLITSIVIWRKINCPT